MIGKLDRSVGDQGATAEASIWRMIEILDTPFHPLTDQQRFARDARSDQCTSASTCSRLSID